MSTSTLLRCSVTILTFTQRFTCHLRCAVCFAKKCDTLNHCCRAREPVELDIFNMREKCDAACSRDIGNDNGHTEPSSA